MNKECTKDKKPASTRTYIGVGGTILWVFLLSCLCFRGWEDMKTLKPNEWGDMLAGWFAPLALFWIVLGYLQQGDELKLNTQALMLQQQELQEQSTTLKEQMMALSRQAQALELQASVSQDEAARALDREKEEIKPKFVSRGGVGSNDCMRITIDNRGGYAASLKLQGPETLVMLASPESVDKGGSASITIHGKVSYPTHFKIFCQDLKGNKFEQEYVLFGHSRFIEKELYDPDMHNVTMAGLL